MAVKLRQPTKSFLEKVNNQNRKDFIYKDMNTNYVTEQEFDKYLEDITKAMDNYNKAFLDATKSIKTLIEKVKEQEERLLLHQELFEQYIEVQKQTKRFIDWIGTGNPLDPINIGVSLSYDKFNRSDLHKPSHKPKINSGFGCLISILIFLSITLFVGLATMIF